MEQTLAERAVIARHKQLSDYKYMGAHLVRYVTGTEDVTVEEFAEAGSFRDDGGYLYFQVDVDDLPFEVLVEAYGTPIKDDALQVVLWGRKVTDLASIGVVVQGQKLKEHPLTPPLSRWVRFKRKVLR